MPLKPGLGLFHSIRAAVLVAATAAVAGRADAAVADGHVEFRRLSARRPDRHGRARRGARRRRMDGFEHRTNRRADRAGDPESADSVRRRLEGARADARRDRARAGARPPHQHHGNDRDDPTRPTPVRPPTGPTPSTADVVLLPNPFFAAYEAIAARLKTAAPGTTIPAYQGGPNPHLHPGRRFRDREDSDRRAADRGAAHARDAFSDGTAGARGRRLGRRGRSAPARQRPGTVDRIRPRRHRIGLDPARRHLPRRRRTGERFPPTAST